MKTIIKQTLPFLLALCMHGCIIADYQTDISWVVENKTDRTITVSVMKSSSGGDSRTLAPGGKMNIAPEQSLFDSKRKISRTASFAYMPAKEKCFVLSDTEILRIWRRSEKNDEGKQFFNPSSWHCDSDEKNGISTYVWTFQIFPQDLETD